MSEHKNCQGWFCPVVEKILLRRHSEDITLLAIARAVFEHTGKMPSTNMVAQRLRRQIERQRRGFIPDDDYIRLRNRQAKHRKRNHRVKKEQKEEIAPPPLSVNSMPHNGGQVIGANPFMARLKTELQDSQYKETPIIRCNTVNAAGVCGVPLQVPKEPVGNFFHQAVDTPIEVAHQPISQAPVQHATIEPPASNDDVVMRQPNETAVAPAVPPVALDPPALWSHGVLILLDNKYQVIPYCAYCRLLACLNPEVNLVWRSFPPVAPFSGYFLNVHELNYFQTYFNKMYIHVLSACFYSDDYRFYLKIFLNHFSRAWEFYRPLSPFKEPESLGVYGITCAGKILEQNIHEGNRFLGRKAAIQTVDLIQHLFVLLFWAESQTLAAFPDQMSTILLSTAISVTYLMRLINEVLGPFLN